MPLSGRAAAEPIDMLRLSAYADWCMNTAAPGGERMTGRPFDADIIVAGAGPSGLMVSFEAKLGGARVLTLEKRSGPTWARAGTLAPRVMEIFASRGIADKVLARAFELHADPRSSRGVWAGLMALHYDKLDTDYPYILLFAQIETERLLAEQFTSLGGEIRLQTEVLDHKQDKHGVNVRVRTADGSLQTLRGRYLVGADGNKSAVRAAAGIQFLGDPGTRRAVNVDAFIDNPYKTNLTQFNNEAGWGMAYPLRNGVTRLAVIDAKTTRDNIHAPVSKEEALAMLRRVHGSDFGISRVDAINSFHDAMYMAEKMRDGRVFLVGESVRVHYPAAGVGMNFCLQDAFNLGWKLAAVVNGVADDVLLDSYEVERRPEIEALLNDVRRQCAIQFNFDREHIVLKQFLERELIPLPAVNLHLCKILAGFAARYPAAEGVHNIVGRRLPNMIVRTISGGFISTFELLRRQQFLLLDLSGMDAGIAAPLNGRMITANLSAPVEHPELVGLGAVLVRPDGHVAWAGEQSLASYVPLEEISRWIKLPSGGRKGRASSGS
jgi:2-polyprenyl-6-methoxyphenol hydroxylase-like FAD-dependent oxidoreductase